VKPLIDDLKGKRLVALDYGRKRVGLAVCDELHITVSPRKFYDITDDKFWNDLLVDLATERAGAIIVGVPFRLDNIETEIIKEIRQFIVDIKERTDLPVYEQDEAFSSVDAMKTMLSNGTKKSKRAKKGSADKIAAAIILRDFLQELEG
jgi:putative Holliday junction resolvase